jgi:hypothetical protein
MLRGYLFCLAPAGEAFIANSYNTPKCKNQRWLPPCVAAATSGTIAKLLKAKKISGN